MWCRGALLMGAHEKMTDRGIGNEEVDDVGSRRHFRRRDAAGGR